MQRPIIIIRNNWHLLREESIFKPYDSEDSKIS